MFPIGYIEPIYSILSVPSTIVYYLAIAIYYYLFRVGRGRRQRGILYVYNFLLPIGYIGPIYSILSVPSTVAPLQ